MVHNPLVSARPWRAIVALALVPWFLCSSAIPQEHLHETDADHAHSLVHRHLEGHPFESHDHDGAEVTHHEERIVWLSDASLFQTTYHFEVSWAVVGPSFETSRDTASWFATASYDASPPHGPPRPSRSPRAPPLTSA